LPHQGIKPNTLQHVRVLDGLRGIAILLVLWWHLPEEILGSFNKILLFVFQPGYLGVDIFFVLSGFLITRILLSEKARSVSVFGFLVRRVARIFPAYYLMLLIVGVVASDTNGLWWSFAYLSNFYFAFDPGPSMLRHTWSLAVEEHFYLVWPWLVAFLSVRKSRAFIIRVMFPTAIGLAILTAYAEPMAGFAADSLIYRITWYRMLSLGAGALLAYHEDFLRASPKVVLNYAIGIGALGALILPTAVFVDHRWVGPVMLVGFSCVSSATVMGALWLEWTKARLAAVLHNRVLAFIGKISYGLYLYHYPVFLIFGITHSTDHDPAGPVRSLAAVFVSVAIAWTSFTFFERPIQQFVRRWLKARQ